MQGQGQKQAEVQVQAGAGAGTGAGSGPGQAQGETNSASRTVHWSVPPREFAVASHLPLTASQHPASTQL